MSFLRASIDLGTNTCLMLIARWDENARRVRQTVEDHFRIVRLGQGVDQNRTLHPDAMERTLKCLKDYAEAVKKHGIEPADVVCVATSQARDARNGADFFTQVEKETGFRFRVISGDQEAKLTFLGGLLPGMKRDETAVMDIGGGSTEFVTDKGGTSLDIGSVRFTERYLKSDPVTDAEFWACQCAIDEALDVLKDWRKTLPEDIQLLAVAGTATTVAAWFLELGKYDPSKIESTILTRGDLHRFVEELKWRTIEERRGLKGVERERADVMLAGAMIFWRAMEVLDFPEARVSARGLRYGALSL